VPGYPEDHVCNLLTAFLDFSDLAGLFNERDGRIVQTEAEVADSKGNLFRIDRLVIDPQS